MYRPALVIGLGGTGVLALKHLKSQLLAGEERRVPPQVKLIALDTVKNKNDDLPAQSAGESHIAALRTELEPGEYHWVGGDVWDFSRQIDRGEHPQIGSWFRAGTYLESLPRANFSLERGAGQLRQFGRLAVFYDVAAPARSAIYNLLTRSIDEIRRTGFITTLDVFLVSSIAGGTGAGMFVDIAYLVRKVAEIDHQLGVRLRGFLVLPEAFSAIPGGVKPAMRARAYACMRENKRFMVDFQYDHGYPMNYHPAGQGGIWRNTIHSKLFDFLYHLDGQSRRNPLTTTKPEYGVAAAISDAVAAVLDKAGEGEEDVYDRHQVNVIAQAAQRAGGGLRESNTSFDSAIGVFSLILPMHHISEWLAHRLSLQALDRLLAPSRRDEDGYPVALTDDANAELPGRRGRDDASRFLQVGEVLSLRSGDKVSSTPFFQELSRVALNYRPTDSSVVRELGSREARDWELHLDPPGTTPEIVAVRQRVQLELSSRLQDDVPANQRGETAGSAFDRIVRGVQAYRGLHLGREDVRTGQLQGGQYRVAVREYLKVQEERFRLMLQVEAENVLNGGQNPDEPPSIHRGGKLGFLLDWLGGLEEIMGRFLKAMNEARELREQRGEKKAAVAASQSRRQELEANPGGIFGGRRRREYLEAEQAEIDLERTLTVESLVRELVDGMLLHTRQLRESAESWAATLALGYDSLYGHLLRGERQIRDAIRVEQKVPVREYVWDEAYMASLFSKYAEEAQPGVDNFLRDLSWRQEVQRAGAKDVVSLRLLVKVSQDETENRLGLENRERNLTLVLTPARQVFADAWRQESVLKYLMTRGTTAAGSTTDPNSLAAHLASKADVLLSASGSSVVPANYLHVAHGREPGERAYLDRVRARLVDLTQANGMLNDVVNSSDRFALRLVHTLDLIPLDEVDSYRKAESDYWTHTEEAEDGREVRGRLGQETLHLFPAEVNAAQLEALIPGKLRIGHRGLHNDLVLQMEDMDRFRLFVRCWMLGLIRRDRREGSGGGYENFWALHLPLEKTGSVSGDVPEVEIYLTRPVTGEPDLVEAMKIWNYHRKDVRGEINLPIDYERVLRAVQVTKERSISERLEKGEGVEELAIRERMDLLSSPHDREKFPRFWLERRVLKERQEELRKRIAKEDSGVLARDAAIALFMVLEEDVDSLNIAMDDLLKS